jgi:SAM-dependent methyltransferase
MSVERLEDRGRCPACRSTSRRLAFSDVNRREGLPGTWHHQRCDDCRTVYLDPIPAREHLEALYERGAVDPVCTTPPAPAPDRAGNAGLARSVLRALSAIATGRPHSWPAEPGDGRRILDFGCLGGDKLVEFHQRGWRVAGIDLNTAAIARARQLLPRGLFFARPLEELPEAERFHVIRADNVVEHLIDPEQTLRELARHLVPGGRLFVYVPSGQSLSLGWLKGKSALAWPPFHLQLFSAQGLRTVVERAGLQSVGVSTCTPFSWWEMTARQWLARPGYMGRPVTRSERVAMLAARLLLPLWLAAARTGRGEELVATGHAVGPHV